MGGLQRFSQIMSANINALLDKCEDPAKMIDQYLREMNENLAEVKSTTASLMAEEKRMSLGMVRRHRASSARRRHTAMRPVPHRYVRRL